MHPDQQSPSAAGPSPTKDASRTPQAKAPPRKGSRSALARSPSPADVPTAAGATGTDPWGELGDRFRQMILDDEEVWLRILRYEVRLVATNALLSSRRLGLTIIGPLVPVSASVV
jgi:hypothetical protein